MTTSVSLKKISWYHSFRTILMPKYFLLDDGRSQVWVFVRKLDFQAIQLLSHFIGKFNPTRVRGWGAR